MPVARFSRKCASCGEKIHQGDEISKTGDGWAHAMCVPSNATYLAEIEDTEGHPMAIRVPLGVIPDIRPPCQHRHSRLCAH